MTWKCQRTRENCYCTPRRCLWSYRHFGNTSRIRERSNHFENLFPTQSKQDLQKAQKCCSEFWWITRFLLHAAQLPGSNLWVCQQRQRNQITHSHLQFIFTTTTKSSTRRYESQRLTWLWLGSRNVWEWGWRSGERTRLPPMWVEFVVRSRSCSEGLSPGTLVFLLPQKPTFPNFNSTWKQWREEPPIQTVQTEKQTPKNKKCYKFGKNYPKRGQPCPALKETYKHCHKKGHFINCQES